MLTPAHKLFYRDNGYVVVECLYSQREVARFLDHYMTLRQQPHPGDDTGIVQDPNDPIKRYPRMLHPHKWVCVVRPNGTKVRFSFGTLLSRSSCPEEALWPRRNRSNPRKKRSGRSGG